MFAAVVTFIRPTKLAAALSAGDLPTQLDAEMRVRGLGPLDLAVARRWLLAPPSSYQVPTTTIRASEVRFRAMFGGTRDAPGPLMWIADLYSHKTGWAARENAAEFCCPLCSADEAEGMLALPAGVIQRLFADDPTETRVEYRRRLARYCQEGHAFCPNCATPTATDPEEFGSGEYEQHTSCDICADHTCTDCCDHMQCAARNCDRYMSRDDVCGDCDCCTSCCSCTGEDEGEDEDSASEPISPPEIIEPGIRLFPNMGAPEQGSKKPVLVRSLRKQMLAFTADTGTRPSARLAKEMRFAFPRHVGLEIEMANAAWTERPRGMLARSSVVHDGSVRGYSPAELVTPPMQGLFVDEFFTGLAVMRNRETNDSCGLHVHVNAADLEYGQVAQVMRAWAALQPAMFNLVSRPRHYVVDRSDTTITSFGFAKECGLLYARTPIGYRADARGETRNTVLQIAHTPLPNHYSPEYVKQLDLYAMAQMTSRSVRSRKLVNGKYQFHNIVTPSRGGSKYHSARYAAMNVYSWVRNKTIEFRLHHGTTDVIRMRHWASLCSRFVDWAACRATAREIEALSNMNPVADVGCTPEHVKVFDAITRGNVNMMDYVVKGA